MASKTSCWAPRCEVCALQASKPSDRGAIHVKPYTHYRSRNKPFLSHDRPGVFALYCNRTFGSDDHILQTRVNRGTLLQRLHTTRVHRWTLEAATLCHDGAVQYCIKNQHNDQRGHVVDLTGYPHYIRNGKSVS